jgi:hypothetical protein
VASSRTDAFASNRGPRHDVVVVDGRLVDVGELQDIR